MRKFVAVFVLLAVLGLCVPSYGYVLIYRANIVAKGVDANADEAIKGSAKAYLVLDMDDDTDDVAEADLILYGKMAGGKVFLDLGNVLEDFGRYAGDTAIVIDLGILGSNDTVLVGQVRSRGVGVTGKKPIPGLVKGRLIQTDLVGGPTWPLDTDILFVGYADFELAWADSMTKKANKAEMTLSDVVDELVTYLDAHGYTNLD